MIRQQDPHCRVSREYNIVLMNDPAKNPMLNRTFATVTTALLFFATTPSAHAEFRIGVEGWTAKTEAGGAIIHAGKTERGGTVSPFVQFRRGVKGVEIGAHFGVGFGWDVVDFRNDEAFGPEDVAGEFVHRDGTKEPITVTYDKKTTRTKSGRALEAAVLIAFPSARITPLAMVGWNSFAMETTVSQSGEFTIGSSGETRVHSRVLSSGKNTFTG